VLERIIDQAPEGQTWGWQYKTADGVDCTPDPGRNDKGAEARVIIVDDTRFGQAMRGAFVAVFAKDASDMWALTDESDVLPAASYDRYAYRYPDDFRALPEDIDAYVKEYA
jgi:hypothetical protein